MSAKIVNEVLLVEFVRNNFEKLNLSSSLYKSVKIISIGQQNFTDGPDFLDATVSFDGKFEKGDIEIHLNSSFWYLHNHHTDTRYSKTLLNICIKDDSKEGYNMHIDKIIPIACVDKELFTEYMKREILHVPYKNVVPNGLCQSFHENNIPEKLLQKFGMERFYTKIRKFNGLIVKYGLDEAFYMSILEALGYVHNTKGFVKLATDLPMSYLKKLCKENKIATYEDLYDLYLNAIGHVNWNTKAVYPAANPKNRLKMISPFIFYILSENIHKLIKFMYDLYNSNKLEEFLNRFIKSSFLIKNITFNVILPYCKILDERFTNKGIYDYKVLPLNYMSKYAITRMFKKDTKYKLKKEIYQQGLIYLSKNYCAHGLKGCESCPLYLEYTS